MDKLLLYTYYLMHIFCTCRSWWRGCERRLSILVSGSEILRCDQICCGRVGGLVRRPRHPVGLAVRPAGTNGLQPAAGQYICYTSWSIISKTFFWVVSSFYFCYFRRWALLHRCKKINCVDKNLLPTFPLLILKR